MKENLKKVKIVYKLCIIGLGNPGKKYNKTRHNIGKDLLLSISQEFINEYRTKLKFEGDYGESHDNEILWIMPNNYVNNSGSTIAKILKSTNLKLNQLLIIHEDLDLDVGEVRFKDGGGHGGHNGIKDILSKSGKEFKRLRIGIGHPGHKEDVTNWVLTKFTPKEESLINLSIDKLKPIMSLIYELKFNEAQKKLHTK